VKNYIRAIPIIIISLLVSGCLSGPERSAKNWFEAVSNMEGTRMFELTCQEERENVQMSGMVSSAMSLLPQLFLGIDLQGEVDLSDLTYTELSNDERIAYVNVSGEVRVAVLAFPASYTIDETWKMVFEENKWKWCGEIN